MVRVSRIQEFGIICKNARDPTHYDSDHRVALILTFSPGRSTW